MVFVLVVSYIVLLTLGWGGQTKTEKRNILIAFDAFTFLLILEFSLKWFGSGKTYFTKPWNIADFCILILQCLSIYLNHSITI
jgi:hypothetical protein